ncbi:MAG: GTPase ObgE [Candidatus Firestonebacteria bacterium]
MFIDKVKVIARAGAGGNGCVSFRREKGVPKGGPDGGNGGKGSSIFFVGTSNMTTLLDFKYKPFFEGERGEHGMGKKMYGKHYGDMTVKVPLGTVVKDLDSGEILYDITEEGKPVLIARGGKGGRGNASYKCSTNRVPRSFEFGEEGEEKSLLLELKTIADIGIIGYPNAGKSTLLSKVSKAHPKIANYPFTTLSPNLGVVIIEEGVHFTWADIPGIIEGAHTGAGLGDEFLRHIERTKVLVHVIDVSALERDAVEDFKNINKELGLYSKEMLSKPQLVAANKVDMPDAKKNFEKLKKALAKKRVKVFPISAIKGEGTKELVFEALKMFNKLRK